MSVLSVRNITKEFPGIKALDDVSVEFESGVVNALVGKNGSGKSTLVKIINGAQPPTAGEIFLDGKPLRFSNPKEAFDCGIATVYQELSLIQGMNVAENIFLNKYPMKGKFIDWAKTYAMTQALLDEMGIDINPREMIYNLSMWQCQMIEIAKAMSTNPKVLLLDEPTSSLALNETHILFELIRKCKERDVIVLYISHRLQELWEIADTCTVLRDGCLIGKKTVSEMKQQELLSMMFGKTKQSKIPEDLKCSDEVIMKAENIVCGNKVKNVSFSLYKGEVLGIAGMLGSGRTELMRAIFGIDKMDSGTLFIEDKKVEKLSPTSLREIGVGMTPEDRKNEGLIQSMSIKNNLCVAALPLLVKRFGFIDTVKEDLFSDTQIERLDIKASTKHALVSSLSGGNQQKVVIGKWLNRSPKIMIFDEPSRGIDVNAKQQIFSIIWELSRQGVSSIVISSELEELLDVCQRVLIMRYGEFVGEVQSKDVTTEQLYALCMGE